MYGPGKCSKELVTRITCQLILKSLDARFQLVADSTHCNEIWLHFLYDNYYYNSLEYFKAPDNQLKCQPSGVVEFCPKKEKVEGVACSCMNVKQYTCIMELFAHAETSLERSTRVGWTEACYAWEEFGCHRLVTCHILLLLKLTMFSIWHLQY